MSDYTPSTEEMRTSLCGGDTVRLTMFDRWLAEHDRQVKAEAWDEGIIWQQTANGIPFAHLADELHANPYREAVTE